MDWMQVLGFLAVVTAASALLHAYVARRLLATSRLGPAGRRRAWIAVILHALALPWVFLLLPFTGELWADRLQWVGWLVWGVLSVLFGLLLVRDLGWGLALAVQKGTGRGLPADPSRRAFLARGLNLAILAITAGITGLGVVQARRRAEVKHLRIPVPGLPDALRGFRIAQISDLHVGPTIRDADMRGVVEVVNGLGADLVAVTGDLVDGPVEALAPHVAPLGGLRARHGTWFVTGNHEYYSGAAPWCAHCSDALGWTVLLNEHRVLEHDGARILVAGVTDPDAGRFLPEHASDPRRAVQGAPETDFRLLLAHQPRSAPAAAEVGFDLQLSGHTHGGQYFPYTVFVYLAQRFVAGLHRLKGMWVYVNRGTTYWGPPLRLGSAQEITLVELDRA